jgi:hypothetical protein
MMLLKLILQRTKMSCSDFPSLTFKITQFNQPVELCETSLSHIIVNENKMN